MILRFCTFCLLLFFISCQNTSTYKINISKGDNIVLIGNNLCSRMQNYGHFETSIQALYRDSFLIIRNMCDGGNTPSFRPHSGRNNPWAFEGAEQFHSELANPSGSEGHFKSEEEWLSELKADIIFGFFGYNESFEGKDALEDFKAELDAFIVHTKIQSYNGENAPELILISPSAFEDLSDQYDLPSGNEINKNLELYSQAISDVANNHNVPYLDIFSITRKWFNEKTNGTIDGFQLTDKSYKRLANYMMEQLFSKAILISSQKYSAINNAVKDKNWFWHNDFKIPNGVHVFGRRYNPFGPDNYPFELQKIREMTSIRDSAIWAIANNHSIEINKLDQQTITLPPVETNFKVGKYGTGEVNYLYGEDALKSLKIADGYKVEIFASEEDFPDLANPVQLSFDNKGRLWVAVMPTYPHYKPGDKKPNDKLIILEDTNNDGKADKQTIWADNLHIPVGFEFAPEGVYISQGTNLKLLSDTDGDNKADTEEIILSGFDDHDTHHVISAFCADPSGAIYMGEGVFLHTNVETPYGPVRATNGGFFRYSPQRKHLERTAQVSIPNPWGHCI